MQLGAPHPLQTQQRSVCALPLALSLNCQVEGDAEREFWRVQQQAGLPWVPLGIRMSLEENGRLHVQEREGKEWKNSDCREKQSGEGQCKVRAAVCDLCAVEMITGAAPGECRV